MKTRVKRVLAAVLTLVMLLSMAGPALAARPMDDGDSDAVLETPPVLEEGALGHAHTSAELETPAVGEEEQAELFATSSPKKAAGDLESAYMEWAPSKTGVTYTVEYKLSSASSWTRLQDDDAKFLIREYPGYMRVDIPGLKAGTYQIRAIPDGNTNNAVVSGNLTVQAHDRSGFAFVGATKGVGAYNDDGTLKSNAVVLYVTEKTKNTVTMDVVTSSKGATTSCTGIQYILDSYQKGYETRPLDVRIVGNITDPAWLQDGDMLVKGSGASKRLSCGVTIEGIGKDAVCNGWGIRVANASYVEIRNLGFMNCNSGEGDDIGLQQNNDHCWVHNNDLFYGDAGSDADQVKGDGALDTKTSSYITHSYNHFWDNGKCNLQGMKSESTTNYITYHHNWYDHSDSRHPRIRTCSVHIYNNYYDGNAKYGVGMTMGGSAFVENNYFRNCKYPMLISGQGSDKATGGTFSGEAGGIIKSYGNYMTGQKAWVTYQKNSTEFDAYEVSSRSTTVPASVTAKSGGSTYNNFDTSSSIVTSDYFKSGRGQQPQTAEAAKTQVMAWAGRVQGGDLQWTFNNSVDDSAYAVNTALKSALTGYKTTMIGTGGKVTQSVSGSGATTCQHSAGRWVVTKEPTCTTTGTREQHCALCDEVIATETLPSQHTDNGSGVCSVCGTNLGGSGGGSGTVDTTNGYVLKAENFKMTDGEFNEALTATEVSKVASGFYTMVGTVKKRLPKAENAGTGKAAEFLEVSNSGSAGFSFTMPTGGGTVTVVWGSTGNGKTSNLVIKNAGGTAVKDETYAGTSGSSNTATTATLAAGSYTVASKAAATNGIRLYQIVVVPNNADAGHTHTWTTTTRAATCTKDGATIQTCACGETVTTTIPALGHNWSATTTTKPDGTVVKTCSRCDAEDVISTPEDNTEVNTADVIFDITKFDITSTVTSEAFTTAEVTANAPRCTIAGAGNTTKGVKSAGATKAAFARINKGADTGIEFTVASGKTGTATITASSTGATATSSLGLLDVAAGTQVTGAAVSGNAESVTSGDHVVVAGNDTGKTTVVYTGLEAGKTYRVNSPADSTVSQGTVRVYTIALTETDAGTGGTGTSHTLTGDGLFAKLGTMESSNTLPLSMTTKKDSNDKTTAYVVGTAGTQKYDDEGGEFFTIHYGVHASDATKNSMVDASNKTFTGEGIAYTGKYRINFTGKNDNSHNNTVEFAGKTGDVVRVWYNNGASASDTSKKSREAAVYTSAGAAVANTKTEADTDGYNLVITATLTADDTYYVACNSEGKVNLFKIEVIEASSGGTTPTPTPSVVTHTFKSMDLATGTASADKYEAYTPDTFFTVYYKGSKTKVDTSSKTWEEVQFPGHGYAPATENSANGTRRFNTAAAAAANAGPGVAFTPTKSKVTVQIWWVQGGGDTEGKDGSGNGTGVYTDKGVRQMALFRLDNASVLEHTDLQHTSETVGAETGRIRANTLEYTEFKNVTVEANQTYLVGCQNGGNYIYKIVVRDGGGDGVVTEGSGSGTVAVTGVTLDRDSLDLSVDGSVTLTAAVVPANATNQNVTWTSSNSAVATVDSVGTVTGVSAGTATITVTTADGSKTATCSVTVSAAADGGVCSADDPHLAGSVFDLAEGNVSTHYVVNTAGSKVYFYDSSDTGSFSNSHWGNNDSSSALLRNRSSATQSGNKCISWTVVGGTGPVTVTNSATSKSVTVTFVGNSSTGTETVAVTGVTLSIDTVTLDVGRTQLISATVAPANATNKNISWSSSDENVATVSESGLVTAVGAGEATITVTTADGNKTATCAVTVTAPLNQTGIVAFPNESEYSGTADDTKTFDNGFFTLTASGASTKIAPAGVKHFEAGTSNEYNTPVTSGTDKTLRLTLNKEANFTNKRDTIQFTAKAGDVVKVWWVASSANRGIEIVNAASPATELYKSTATTTETTNSACFSQYAVTAAGTYLLGFYDNGGSSGGYIYKIQVGAPETVNVTRVSLNQTSAELNLGETVTLTATVYPTDAENKAVTWSSSNENVATVNNGLVTAHAGGTATITVTTADGGKTATCAVTVVAEPAVYVLDATEDLTAFAAGSKTDGQTDEKVKGYFDLIYSSHSKVDTSNKHDFLTDTSGYAGAQRIDFNQAAVLTGSEGNPVRNVIRFTTRGAATVQVWWVECGGGAGNGAVRNIGIYDVTDAVKGHEVDKTHYTGADGDPVKNDPVYSVLHVDAAGTYYLTGVEDANYFFRVVVTDEGGLTPGTAAVTGVSLNKSSTQLRATTTETLTATVAPANATTPNVIWSTSDESVATVVRGVVTGVKAGTATITATTVDGGKSASCTVTVTPNIIAVTGVTLNKTETTLTIGGTETLVATVAPDDATNKAVTWSSSDATVAGVTNAGVVTALKKGSATITVTTADGNKTATCAVTVNKQAGPAAPTIAVTGKTASSITVTANPDWQYKLGDGQWQDSNVFSGLTANHAYSIVARVKETETRDASAESAAVNATTNKLTQTITITNEAPSVKQNETLDLKTLCSSNASGATLTYTQVTTPPAGTAFNAATGVVTAGETTGSFQVRVSSAAVGTGDGAYDAAAAKTITVTITRKTAQVFATGFSAAATVTYGDNNNAFSRAASLTTGNGAITYSSSNTAVATVNASTGAVTIQKAGSVEITATAAETSDYARATANYTLTVDPREVVIQWAGHTDRKYGDNKVVTATIANKVGSDQVSLVVDGGDASDVGSYTAEVRLTGGKAGSYTLPADNQITYTIAKADAPAAPTIAVTGKTATSLTVTANSEWEYKLDNGSWQDTNVFTGLVANHTYSVTARVKETATRKPSAESAAVSGTTDKLTQTITVSNASPSVKQHETLDVKALCSSNANGATLTYTLSGTLPEGTTFENGVVTAGTTTGSFTVKVNSAAVGTGDGAYAAAAEKTITVTITRKTAQSFNAGFSAVADKTYGDNGNTFTRTASLVTGNGAITYASGNPAVATVNATTGAVTILKAGTTVITATAAETSNYAQTTANYTLNVEPLEVVIQWANHTGRKYGDGLEVTATIANKVGNDVVSLLVENGDATAVGTHIAEVQLAGAKAGSYTLPTVHQISYTIAKADAPAAPTIDLVSKTAASITVTPNATWQYKLDGGSWQDSNVFNGLTANHTYSIVARVKETATQFGSEESAALSVTTNKLAQVINVDTETPSVKQHETLDLNTMCVSNAPGAVLTFTRLSAPPEGTVFDAATGVITAGTTTGSFQVRVSSAAVGTGDGAYDAAAAKTLTITITNKTAQIFAASFGTAASMTYGDSGNTFGRTAILNVGDGAITYESSNENVATVNAATGEVTVLKAGETEITATAAETADYAQATANYTLTIDQLEVDIVWGNVENRRFGDGKKVTATIGNKVGSDQVSLSVTGGDVTAVGTHTAEVQLTGAKAASYKLPEVHQIRYTIAKAAAPAAPSISLVSKSAGSITVTANAAWQYRKDSGAWQDSNVFTGLVANHTYSITARVKETATQEASAESAAVRITTDKLTQTITLTTASPSVKQGGTLDLKALCSSNAAGAALTLAVVGDLPSGTTFVDGVITAGTATGTFQVKVNSAAVGEGDGAYAAAEAKTFTVTVIDKEPQIIAADFSAAVNMTYGDNGNLFTRTANRTVGDGTVTYSSSNTSVATVHSTTGAVTILKAGEAEITATAAATKDFAQATAHYTLTVEALEVMIQWNNVEGRKYNDGKTVTATILNKVGEDDVALMVTGGAANTVGTHTAEAQLTGAKAGCYTLPADSQKDYTIAKADAPAAPTIALVSKTASSITVTSNAAWEYKKDNGSWQDSNVFNGLMANHTYVIYARVKETPIRKPSDLSAGLSVTTDKLTQTITVTTEEPSVKQGDSLDLNDICSSNVPGAALTFAKVGDLPLPTGTTFDPTTGVITAGTQNGTFQVKVNAPAIGSGDGAYAAAEEKIITVTITAKDRQSFASGFGAAAAATYGDSFSRTAKLSIGNGAITYASGNTAVAEVNATTGAVTIKKPGTVKITATAAETDTYASATANYTLTVEALEVEIVWANVEDRVFGDNKVVTATIGNKIGTDDVALTVTGGDETAVGAHTAEVELTGAKAECYKLPDVHQIGYIIARPAALSITVESIAAGIDLSCSQAGALNAVDATAGCILARFDTSSNTMIEAFIGHLTVNDDGLGGHIDVGDEADLALGGWVVFLLKSDCTPIHAKLPLDGIGRG